MARPGTERSSSKGHEVVRVFLLGTFRVTVGSRSIGQTGWRLRKAGALVKLLALAPEHRMHRERVMDRLWPDLDPAVAANNLRQALHVARRTLGPGAARCLRLRGEMVALCPDSPLWVDIDAFQDAAAAVRRTRDPAAYRVAIELYTGDLLPGDLYEEWTELRREELRQVYLILLVELAGLHEEREDYGPAIEALGRVVTSEPAHEAAHAGLMRLYALSGQRGEALRQYGRLLEVLSAEEFGAEPGAETGRLYEEISAGTFPPTRPPAAGALLEEPPPNPQNLPVARTSFVGREREVVEVKRLLAMTDLLTLTGPGGSGKTRLAVEVARDLVGSYPDGVWLVELAPLSDPELVPGTVAGVMGVREQPNRPLTDTLAEALKTRKLLLVLDNCEHLIDACARLMDVLLGSCPRVRVLATSREPLNVAGEVVWPVPSLSVPDIERPPTVEGLKVYESARLFVERALYRPSSFVLIPEVANAVAEICQQLDGMPLAIELAAARVGTLAVGQISERLGDSLKLLTGGDRTATPRQQTLRGTLDWSYDLLSEPEKRLFCRLAIFAGGWTLEAAETVGASEGVEEGDVLDLLGRLVDKSLVVAEAEPEGSLRYRFLEPVRQYAQEKLDESGEADAVRRRHGAFFLAMAEEAETELQGTQQEALLERLETEHDNLRAALQWFLERGEAGPALRLCGALGEFWHMHGHLSEGRRWLEAALGGEGSGLETLRIKALSKAAFIGWEQGEFERSISLSQESLALSRRTGDRAGAAVALYNLGFATMFQEEYERATTLFEEAVALQRELGDEVSLARALQGLGLTVMAQGDFGRAEALYEEGLALARRAGDALGIELLLLGLGLAALGQDEYGRARELCAEALKLSQRLDYRHSTAASLHILASVAGSERQPVRAARLWGAAEALREAIGTGLSPVEQAYYARHIAAARSRLDEEAWQAAWAEGRMLTPEEAVEYGLPAEEPALPATLRSAPEASAGPSDAARVEPASRGAALHTRMTALARAGRIAWEQGDYEAAEALSEECLALSRELGDVAGRAEALNVLGLVAMSRVELERASAMFEEAMTLQRELGDKARLAFTIQGLGFVEVSRRDLGRAAELHEESLALAREAGDNFGIMLSLGLGALVAAHRGEHERARALCAGGLEAARPTGSTHGVILFLDVSVVSASSQGQSARAGRLWGAAGALRETIGTILQPIERRDYGPYIDAARARLGEAAWEAALEEGRRMTQEEAVEYALSEEEPVPSAEPATPGVPAGRPDALTARQKEISVLVARGFTNRRIASELTISERTVETHIGKILKKLGLSSRTQLATWVIQRWPPPQNPS